MAIVATNLYLEFNCITVRLQCNAADHCFVNNNHRRTVTKAKENFCKQENSKTKSCQCRHKPFAGFCGKF